MGSKTRLSSYCTKRANNGVNLVTSRKINTRLARPISNNLLADPDRNCLTMRVIQCVRSYDPCDLYSIISRSRTRKDLLAEDICDYAAI